MIRVAKCEMSILFREKILQTQEKRATLSANILLRPFASLVMIMIMYVLPLVMVMAMMIEKSFVIVCIKMDLSFIVKDNKIFDNQNALGLWYALKVLPVAFSCYRLR